MKSTIIIGLIATILLSGCARLNSIARDFNVNEGIGQLIDAKQRAIIVVQKKKENNHGTKNNDTNYTVVCAEPSPDALSAYAMQMALEGKIPDGTALKLAGSSQEGTSFIGLRTQSIQLLRDAMYRNCEAYANGAIDEAEYAIASRRHQRNMVALLAIEQLTGAIRVPPMTITSEGAAEVAKSLSQLQTEADALDEGIDQLEQQIKDINTTNKQDDEVKALTDKKTKLEHQKSSKEKNRKAIEKGIENARGAITTGKTYATVHGDGIISRSDQHIENVSAAVVGIFENINGADDFAQMCLSYLMKDRNSSVCGENNNTINCICLNHLAQLTKTIEMHNQTQAELNKRIKDINISEVKKMLQEQNPTYSNNTTKSHRNGVQSLNIDGSGIKPNMPKGVSGME